MGIRFNRFGGSERPAFNACWADLASPIKHDQN